jgi:hypothetical protein
MSNSYGEYSHGACKDPASSQSEAYRELMDGSRQLASGRTMTAKEMRDGYDHKPIPPGPYNPPDE